jgi:hypothetical protein
MTEQDPQAPVEYPVAPETELYAPVMELPASTARAYMAVMVLFIFGFLMVSVALKTPSISGLSMMLFVLVGGVALYGAYAVWRVIGTSLRLTADELRDNEGRLVCLVKDVKSVESGTFAFKPSNGFMIVLKARTSSGWAPGLWWAFGTRIGVGGVTSSGAGKAMADVLAVRVASLATKNGSPKA